MQMVTIRFPDAKSRAQGFYELIKRVRVVCLPDDEFMISDRGLAILEAQAVPYRVVEECGLDHALETLRDTAATAV